MCRTRWRRRRDAQRDGGSVDVSIEMLFGTLALILVVLVVFDAVAYWHARNVFDDAAAEGARIAAAFDGSCASGVAAARAELTEHGGSWSRDASVSCSEGAVVSVTVSGATPGVLGGALGFRAHVTESAPKEG
jgi:hypothetical protein